MARGPTRAQRGRAFTAEIQGLEEFLAELRKMGLELDNQLKVNSLIATMVRDRARAASPGRLQQAIQKRATNEFAAIRVIRMPPDALGRFMGANRRFGWYAHPRYQNSTGRQFEKWVGNQWDPGANAGKPYYIGDAINSSVDELVELYGDDIMQKAKRAFPQGR